ncbi:MAG: acyl-CoA/acyl-ACP dehydrogenase [Halioglobus sp.]|nr:acyl-CoA/acyl-ACP dehydrogenase [Halioglobus sp.]
MNFLFSDDQQTIAGLVAKILSDRVTDEFRRDFAGRGEPYDRELWSTLAEAGMLGVALPEACGGSGMGMVELCLMLQAQGHCLAPVPLLSTLVAGAMPIAEFGSASQQQRYLGAVVAGETVLTAALGELGKAPQALVFEAADSADKWVLSGTAEAVPYARQAAAILLPARIGDEMALFVVDRQTPGVALTDQHTTNGEPVARLALDDVELDSEALLCRGPEGWAWLEHHVLVAAAALQLGVAEEALRRTAQYTSERRQFGQPISSFQAVAHRAADGYIDLEAMRSTLWQAAWRLAQGLPATAEVRAARWWASEGGYRIAHSAQHLHGGIGADVDYPLHRFFLWAKQLELLGGGARAQMAILGQQLTAAARHRQAQ